MYRFDFEYPLSFPDGARAICVYELQQFKKAKTGQRDNTDEREPAPWGSPSFIGEVYSLEELVNVIEDHLGKQFDSGNQLLVLDHLDQQLLEEHCMHYIVIGPYVPKVWEGAGDRMAQFQRVFGHHFDMTRP
jgi:hypothetical protein